MGRRTTAEKMTAKIRKIDIKRVFLIYIIVYSVVLLIFHSVNKPTTLGEWDDYTLPIASVLNDHNFNIDDADIAEYKKLFPDWSGAVDNYKLSGYMTRDGSGQLSWYFPCYAIVCIPCTLLLEWLDLSAIYAFPYTNLMLLVISLVIAFNILAVDEKKKTLLLLALSLNPIVFYIGWPSGEVFIYSMLLMGLVFWYSRMYRRAAVFVSLAGMMNPTIMSIGFFMIGEYLYGLFTQKGSSKWGPFVKENICDVLQYGCCYIIGIIPMIYNLYHVGHINLTASLEAFTQGKESTAARFLSYLLDLNYGILPYFPVIFITSFVLLPAALIKKSVRYIEWSAAFLLNVVLYSIMVHINGGMSGIARYNAWGVLLLIFAVILFYDVIISRLKVRKILYYILSAGTIITGVIVFNYGIFCASKTSFKHFTPIAEWVLDTCPAIYNPLPSTFKSRVSHVGGGYVYKTPLVYENKDGIVRKMLVKKDDLEYVESEYMLSQGPENWFESIFEKMDDKEIYISCPEKYGILKTHKYEIGQELSFKSGSFNADAFVIRGLGSPEGWGTWTGGNEFIMRYRTDSASPLIHAAINAGAYKKQTIVIYINGNYKYMVKDFTGGTIEFDFENPGKNKPVEIRFEMPDAISPSEFGSDDKRVLSLSFVDMVFTEK